jgi:hypothetical protein
MEHTKSSISDFEILNGKKMLDNLFLFPVAEKKKKRKKGKNEKKEKKKKTAFAALFVTGQQPISWLSPIIEFCCKNTALSGFVLITSIEIFCSQPGGPDEFVKKNRPKCSPARFLTLLIQKLWK